MSTLLQNLVISLCHWKEWKFVLAVSTSLPIVSCCPGLQMYFFSLRSHCLYFTAYHLRSSIPLDKLRHLSLYQVAATCNLTLNISKFAHLHCRDWWWSPSYQCIPSLLHIHSNPLLELLLTLVYLIIHREGTNVGRECAAEVKQGSSFHMSCCQ